MTKRQKSSEKPALRYEDAGVSLRSARKAVQWAGMLARQTYTKNVLAGVGAFAGGYLLEGFQQPVLVSSADGVGTKLKIAFLTGIHHTVGQDLVNHCVNDIAVCGARPLFFLDYFATGRLQPEVLRDVLSGIAQACKQNGCTLLGGETAEMPGFYSDGEYDLVGFIVGAVERKKLLTGKNVRAGDLLIGLPSTGLHTNGYSLARKILFEVAGFQPDTFVPELGCTVAEELLKVHRSYYGAILALHSLGILKAAAHITGGGITENLPRVLPEGLAAEIDTKAWPVPPIFQLLQRLGNVPEDECRRTFNMGIGMILVISRRSLKKASEVLNMLGERFYVIGQIVKTERPSRRRVIYK